MEARKTMSQKSERVRRQFQARMAAMQGVLSGNLKLAEGFIEPTTEQIITIAEITGDLLASRFEADLDATNATLTDAYNESVKTPDWSDS